MMTRVQSTRSLRHSGAIPEAALLLEDAFIPTALMLSAILELPHFGDFSSAQDNHDNRSFLIFAFNYTTAIDHPWSPPSVTQFNFLHIHNVKRPPVWTVMDRGGFLCVQSQQSNDNYHDHYNKSTRADHAVTRTHIYHLLSCTQIRSSIKSSPITRRGTFFDPFLIAKLRTKTLTYNSCNSCNLRIIVKYSPPHRDFFQLRVFT